MNTTFGAFLIQERHTRQLSQEAFAQHLQISQATLSRWESDTRQPSVPEVMRLISFLHCDWQNLCSLICNTEKQTGSPRRGRPDGVAQTGSPRRGRPDGVAQTVFKYPSMF